MLIAKRAVSTSLAEVLQVMETPLLHGGQLPRFELRRSGFAAGELRDMMLGTRGVLGGAAGGVRLLIGRHSMPVGRQEDGTMHLGLRGRIQLAARTSTTKWRLLIGRGLAIAGLRTWYGHLRSWTTLISCRCRQRGHLNLRKPTSIGPGRGPGRLKLCGRNATSCRIHSGSFSAPMHANIGHNMTQRMLANVGRRSRLGQLSKEHVQVLLRTARARRHPLKQLQRSALHSPQPHCLRPRLGRLVAR